MTDSAAGLIPSPCAASARCCTGLASASDFAGSSRLTARKSGITVCGIIVPVSKIQVRQDEDRAWIAKSNLLPGCHAHGRDRGAAILRLQLAAKAHQQALM